jgi:hypothetical protein
MTAIRIATESDSFSGIRSAFSKLLSFAVGTANRQLVTVFLVCFFVLLRTTASTVYELDSAELAAGAATLGIVHAPGYPLYTVVAHLFTRLPIGDVAFRVNLLSAVCLALTAPLVFSTLRRLQLPALIAAISTLTFVWSYYVWDTGTAAEIYAPQLFTLALCGYGLIRLMQSPKQERTKWAIISGLLFGVAIATVQSSVFFAPGILVAFLLIRMTWRARIIAGVLAGVVFLSTLLYFPLRYADDPAFNKIGAYTAAGEFRSMDFTTVQGTLAAVTGSQFSHLFFADGLFPSPMRIYMTMSWFWKNYLGIGILFIVAGLVYMARKHIGFFAGWMALFVPYTYFYLNYGAMDRDTMFGPSYLMLVIPLAFGVCWLIQYMPMLKVVAVALPVIALVTNFSAVDLSYRTEVRSRAEAILRELPPNAVVLGYWADVAPLDYLHYVEGQRPDVRIYDMFMFEQGTFVQFIDQLNHDETPIILVSGAALPRIVGTDYTIVPDTLAVDMTNQRLSFILTFRAVRTTMM